MTEPDSKPDFDVLLAILKWERTRKGVSQQAIAEILGYNSGRTIGQWEAGEVEPKLNTLRAWADLLGYDVTLNRRPPS